MGSPGHLVLHVLGAGLVRSSLRLQQELVEAHLPLFLLWVFETEGLSKRIRGVEAIDEEPCRHRRRCHSLAFAAGSALVPQVEPWLPLRLRERSALLATSTGTGKGRTMKMPRMSRS